MKPVPCLTHALLVVLMLATPGCEKKEGEKTTESEESGAEGPRESSGVGSSSGGSVSGAGGDKSLVPGRDNALMTLGNRSWTVGDRVTDIQFFPDGKRFAVAAQDLHVHVLDSESGKHVNAFAGPVWSTRTVAVSPDGKKIGSGDRDRFFVWDVETKKLLASHEHSLREIRYISSVLFSPDGKRIFYGGRDEFDDEDDRVWSYNLEDGKLEGRYAVPSIKGAPSVEKMAVTKDGRLLATADEEAWVRIWQVADRKEVTPDSLLEFDGRSVRALAFQDDDTLLIGITRPCGLARVDIESDTVEVQEGKGCSGMAFSDDAKYLYMAGSTIHRMDVSSGELVNVGAEQEGSAETLAVSPDGSMILTADELQIGVRAFERQEDGTYLRKNPEIAFPKVAVAWLSDGERILAISQRYATLWDVSGPKGKQKWKVELSDEMVNRLMLRGNVASITETSETGVDALIGGDRYTIDLADGTVRKSPAADTWFVSESGTTLEVAGKSVTLNGAPAETITESLKGAEDVSCVALSHDGEQALIAARTQVWIWSTGDSGAQRVADWDVTEDADTGYPKIRRCDISEGVVALDGDSRGVLTYNTDGKLLAKMELRAKRLSAIALSPDGKTVAAGFDRSPGIKEVGEPYVVLWDTQSGEKQDEIGGHLSTVHDVAFTPDGSKLATAGEDGTVRIWGVK